LAFIPISSPSIDHLEITAVEDVLKSGNLTTGELVRKFEKEFSNFVELNQCLAVNSGTSALHLMLLAHGIGPGDEVIVPSFSFAATANSVALTGATPVFCDIELDTFCMDPKSVLVNISSRTRAIMPVHLYGHPAEMDQLLQICRDRKLLLFEDAAQAHLAKYKNKYVGSFGDSAAFSFYSTKNMTTGEGGMIVTKDEKVSRKIELLRNQGQIIRYKNEIVGFNNRMGDLNAAIGLQQINKIEMLTNKRQENAKFYNQNIRNVVTPITRNGVEHVFHQYTIRCVDINRDEFINQLTKLEIGTGIYYPTPIHKLESFVSKSKFDEKTELKNTELISKQCVSIPVHPKLTEKELTKIVESINSVTSAGS
jgi:perosamine synthetase